MHTQEIKTQVLLGSHTAVKAFLKVAIIDRVGGVYDGSGGVFVDAETKSEIFSWAYAAQATLGPAFKISKPWAVQIGDFGQLDCYRFRITVR